MTDNSQSARSGKKPGGVAIGDVSGDINRSIIAGGDVIIQAVRSISRKSS